MTGSVHVVATFAVKGASSQVDDWKLSPDRESVKVVNPSVNPLEIYKRDQLAAYGQGCEFFGEEPHSEVLEYQVSIDADTGDLWATECIFWQPMAAASAIGGQMVDYLYRVPHPYCTLLYKSCPADKSRMDVVALFNQPLTSTQIRGHMLMSYLDEDNDLVALRHFAQTIFAQDKPILENQYPKELPLDPRAETPIRADKIAIAYRRWLSELGVTYGVIPV
jgi:phenylpropionate dioxygenase-like ring-hydroxylating dioxygenase large terminal subunit